MLASSCCFSARTSAWSAGTCAAADAASTDGRRVSRCRSPPSLPLSVAAAGFSALMVSRRPAAFSLSSQVADLARRRAAASAAARPPPSTGAGCRRRRRRHRRRRRQGGGRCRADLVASSEGCWWRRRARRRGAAAGAGRSEVITDTFDPGPPPAPVPAAKTGWRGGRGGGGRGGGRRGGGGRGGGAGETVLERRGVAAEQVGVGGGGGGRRPLGEQVCGGEASACASAPAAVPGAAGRRPLDSSSKPSRFCSRSGRSESPEKPLGAAEKPVIAEEIDASSSSSSPSPERLTQRAAIVKCAVTPPPRPPRTCIHTALPVGASHVAKSATLTSAYATSRVAFLFVPKAAGRTPSSEIRTACPRRTCPRSAIWTRRASRRTRATRPATRACPPARAPPARPPPPSPQSSARAQTAGSSRTTPSAPAARSRSAR